MKKNNAKIYKWLLRVFVILTFTFLACDFLHVYEESALNPYIVLAEFNPILEVILMYPVVQMFVLFLCMLLPGILVTKSDRLLLGLTGLMVVGMLILPAFHKDLSIPSVACILLLTLYQFIMINTKNPYGSKEAQKKAPKTLLFFCLVPVLCVLLIPQTDKPLQWQLVKDIWRGTKEAYVSTRDFIEDTITEMQFATGMVPEEFRMNYAGYAGEGRLGGSLSDSERTQLLLEGKKTGGSLYLIGAVSDTYTGQGWEKNDTGQTYNIPEYQLDYAELIRALNISGMTREQTYYMVDVTRANIYHYGIRTKTLFYPLKTFEVISEKRNPFTVSGPNFTFDKAFKKSSGKYCVVYMDVNYNGASFLELLENEEAFRYDNASVSADELMETQHALFNNMKNEEVFQEAVDILPERKDDIDSKYLQLPETLPERVNELAQSITKDCTTEHDKMEAIRVYLKEYTYSKTPVEITEGDFVDQFLFETKEGYCTYFSSAMTVLGRCTGVPCRYVEGFYNDFSHKDDHGYYEVHGSNGHAWCEYYVEGIGWIPIEGTGGCGYTRDFVRTKVSITTSEYYENQYKDSMTTPGERANQVEQEKIEKEAKEVFNNLLLGICCLVLFAVFVIYVERRLRKQASYRNSSAADKVNYLFRRIQGRVRHIYPAVIDDNWNLSATEWISRLSYLLKEREQAAKRVEEGKKNQRPVKSMPGEEVIREIYLRARYSQESVTVGDVSIFEEILDELKKRTIREIEDKQSVKKKQRKVKRLQRNRMKQKSKDEKNKRKQKK